jgi:FkbM family methyltransferase
MNPFSHLNEIGGLSGYDFETACRFFCKYAYLGDHTGLCRILTKHKLYIDTRDTGITPHLIMDGFWETWLTQCLAGIIRPGDTCIDIGANVGYYSVLMSALAGEKGQTIAIEPIPRIAGLLRQTAGLNYPGFRVAEVALSNCTGETILHIPDLSFGDASILQRSDRVAVSQSKTKVQTITLDLLLEQMNVSKADVIKIDVEGAEPQVLEGMKKTIENNPGLKIIIEYSPYLYADAKGFTDYLFSKFIVRRIKDVDEMQLMDETLIGQLTGLQDHTDLYLELKG